MIDWAVVGRQVVCIKDFLKRTNYEIIPYTGQVLSIREVLIGTISQQVCFRFDEIRNLEQIYMGNFTECMFVYSYFKPVKPTSIECFRNSLKNKTKEKEVENV